MNDSKRKQRRAYCPVCRRVFAVNSDGTIRGHREFSWTLEWCDGASLPATEFVEHVE